MSAPKPVSSGQLRIGDQWNAISVLALSQSNPLKAVAEFVENSIDARAKRITITRGKEKGALYLRIADDGEGVVKNENGEPDFKFVATHICDSIKKRMKAGGATGVQGEFGIGLLSFWTVGDELQMVCGGTDGRAYEMRMRKADSKYEIRRRPRLFRQKGTELTISPLLSGLRQLSGEKIHWFLASELRDRIRNSGVEVVVVDKISRIELKVEPKAYSGRLLREVPPPVTDLGDIYLELYLAEPSESEGISLQRRGTRVFHPLSDLAQFSRLPWTSKYLQGVIDVPFLNLTPGTRLGIIYDEAFETFCTALKSIEAPLLELIEEQERAEEERASKDTLKSIQKAFREALLALPPEEYDWFKIEGRKPAPAPSAEGENAAEGSVESAAPTRKVLSLSNEKPDFFDYPGPLFRAAISPSTCVMSVKSKKTFAALPRDRARKEVTEGLSFDWKLLEGLGILSADATGFCTFEAPQEPGLTRLGLQVKQGDIQVEAEAIITVTDSLIADTKPKGDQKGLPGYTLKYSPGELWRSYYDEEQNVIVVNKGHKDYVFSARQRPLKLRYLLRLFAKEMVLKNFPGVRADQLIERMIEILLYAEENLK